MINNLQLLRAFAAINVVIFHIIGTAESYRLGTVALQNLEGWGQNGVDIFFVISGFVMAYTQSLKPKTVMQFLANRAIRIVPLYWLLTTVLIAIYFLIPSVFRELNLSFEYAISSYLFFCQFLLDKTPLIHVGWTLELEVIFYLIFGLCLVIANKKLFLVCQPSVTMPTR